MIVSHQDQGTHRRLSISRRLRLQTRAIPDKPRPSDAEAAFPQPASVFLIVTNPAPDKSQIEKLFHLTYFAHRAPPPACTSVAHVPISVPLPSRPGNTLVERDREGQGGEGRFLPRLCAQRPLGPDYGVRDGPYVDEKTRGGWRFFATGGLHRPPAGCLLQGVRPDFGRLSWPFGHLTWASKVSVTLLLYVFWTYPVQRSDPIPPFALALRACPAGPTGPGRRP